jgi:PX domain
MEDHPEPSLRKRLLSNESLCISETEYSNLLYNLSPKHKETEQAKIYIEFYSKIKSKHIVYKITGEDSYGCFEALRRYSDFIILRNILASQWPGCYIPKLPPKKRIVKSIQGNLSEEFIDKRMRLLSNFLKKIVLIVHLYFSQAFQLFIKNPESYDKSSKSIKPLSNLDLYLNFKENFPIENSFEFSEETSIYMSQTIYYLKRSMGMIKNMKLIVKKNVENFHKMKFHLCKLTGGLKDLSPVFKNKEVEFNVKRKRYQMFQVLLDWCRSEILDIEAVIEAINYALTLTESLKIKKDATLKNLIEENLESQDLKNTIVKMVQQRLVLYEIPKFREEKAIKWDNVLRRFVSTTALELKNVVDIISEIDKNFNT